MNLPQAPIALEKYRSQIEAALVYADASHAYDDVAAMVAAGQAQFWPGPASVVITEVIAFPRKKVLNIFLAGGILAEIEAMAPGILDWGRSVGCAHAVFTGRKGWARSFLTRTGWSADLTFYSKAL